jgi:lactate permease
MLQSVLTLLPIVWLIIALAILKIQGHKACMVALVITAVLALTLWQMPVIDCATSALEGFAAALWPIILVIIAAIFTYNLSLRTGSMNVIKRLLSSVSRDRRIIILLIGWCFGGFLEGMAGFGTAVAIPAGMLAAMGFDPIISCLVCMLANAFPTAFGSVGIPTVTLVNVTGLESAPVAFTTVVQMVPFMILVPFLMVIAGCGGVKALKGVVGITLVSGLSFVIPELIVSYFIGPELTVIVGCVVSLACTLGMAKMRSGKPVPAEYDMGETAQTSSDSKEGYEMSPIMAFLPYILIFVLLLLTSKLIPPINTFLGQFSSSIKISTSANAGNASFSWINTPGIIIFIATIIGGIIQKASASLMWETLVATVKQMSKTIITIMAVLAVAKIMTYSGMISDMATLFVTIAGKFYPFFAPIIAALGAFVTGSGTNTEVLLGGLQTEAARAIGASQYWLAGANSVGAGIGKIISPQCIATAVAAVGISGRDSEVLSAALKWALLLLVIACLIIGLFQGFSPY